MDIARIAVFLGSWGAVFIHPESIKADATNKFLTRYCIDCHDRTTHTANLDIASLLDQPVDHNLAMWERIVKRLSHRQMPPVDADRPSEDEYKKTLSELTSRLDQHAAANPKPGRTGTFRRLTRLEYRNAIRDCWPCKLTPRSCCRRMNRATDSTTSRSEIYRPRCWNGISLRLKKSVGKLSGGETRSPVKPTGCVPTSRRTRIVPGFLWEHVAER